MLKRLLVAAVAAIVGTTLGLVAPQTAQANDTALYATPGDHLVNGRYWNTECDKYSDSVVRCTTDIWAAKVVKVGSSYVNHEGWVFNNLTYLPSDRGQWDGNPLGTNRTWTAADGRQWRTECDTATTGKGGCRSYSKTDVVQIVNGKVRQSEQWQFNNIVRFATTSVAPVTEIPAAAPKLEGVPVETEPAKYDTCKASYYWQGQRTANGESFNPNALTTAHRSLPFNTKVKVVNPSNGKSVVVRVNDRGPFISGRCLDLSRAAMQTIGGTASGVITVQYQVVG